MATAKSERTKERILRVAERLFAERGYDGVSMRALASGAGVQLALLSYYFRGKQGLYRAVFQRRIDPISDQRLAALREVMERTQPPPTIEEVLDALARPWVELRNQRGGQHYSRLIAREVGDPQESRRGIVKDMLDPIAIEFIGAMEKVLVGRPRAQIHWAYHFFIGALLLVLANPTRAQRLSGALCNTDDAETFTSAIVGFFSASLRMPESIRSGSSAKPVSKPASKQAGKTASKETTIHEARHVPFAGRPATHRRVHRR